MGEAGRPYCLIISSLSWKAKGSSLFNHSSAAWEIRKREREGGKEGRRKRERERVVVRKIESKSEKER